MRYRKKLDNWIAEQGFKKEFVGRKLGFKYPSTDLYNLLTCQRVADRELMIKFSQAFNLSTGEVFELLEEEDTAVDEKAEGV